MCQSPQPTTHAHHTAEKAAHLLLDGGWTNWGIPTTVTSDQGPQFAGRWYRTMCGRLGIRQAFSQAYHPQANGRAEVAGRQLKDVLRKLHAEDGINWVEALPRALRYIHDRVGEGGLSPYKILFGRDRPLAGLPYTPERECLEAKVFFDHIEHVDRLDAERLNQAHAQAQQRHNDKIRLRPAFQVDDLVLVAKPKQVGGFGTQTYWVGPTRIVNRTGENSFEVETPNQGTQAVRISQIKPYFEEPLTGKVPLHFVAGQHKGTPDTTPRVNAVLNHRTTREGTLSFLVSWENSRQESDAWVNITDLIKMGDEKWWAYCQCHGLSTISIVNLKNTTSLREGFAGTTTAAGPQ